jgi:2-succinyl-6-hydroxy-2,4-cyclohexadiene-1-carboxylate synthase
MARVVLVHGFTQTPRSWRFVEPALTGAGHDVVTPTLPGHGGRPPADLPTAAAAMANSHGPAVWVGYSMGGRLCLHLALTRPAAAEGLVLLGATAGIDDRRARNRRRHNDELLATRIEHVGVPAFVDEWTAQPMFSGVPAERLDVDDRRGHDAAGLAGALRLAGTGAQAPLWDRLPELGDAGLPVLLLAGELDGKFKAEARRMASAIGPSTAVEWVGGAGHAAHLERPEAVAAHLLAFLDRSR